MICASLGRKEGFRSGEELKDRKKKMFDSCVQFPKEPMVPGGFEEMKKQKRKSR